MPSQTLHIVFTQSGAHTLEDALEQLGRDDRVVAFPDDLSFGPINPSDPDRRTRWVAEELGYDGWADVGVAARVFWAAALDDRKRRIAWMSRRSAPEYAGFLEFVRQLASKQCEIVDLTETVVETDRSGAPSPPSLAESLGLLTAGQIIASGLPSRSEPLTSEKRGAYEAAWLALRGEDAPLRALRADLAMESAPISFFDRQLLSCARHDWRRAARIVGEVLMTFGEEALCQTGDLVLMSRLRVLAGSGLLEHRGDASNFRSSELRLPASADRA